MIKSLRTNPKEEIKNKIRIQIIDSDEIYTITLNKSLMINNIKANILYRNNTTDQYDIVHDN